MKRTRLLLASAILLAGCSSSTVSSILGTRDTASSSSCGGIENPCPKLAYKKLPMFQDRHGAWIKIADGQVFRSGDTLTWEVVPDGNWETFGYWDENNDRPGGEGRLKWTTEGFYAMGDGGEWQRIGGTWWRTVEGARVGLEKNGTVWETNGNVSDFPDAEGMIQGVKVVE
jgi:hypothetical protein